MLYKISIEGESFWSYWWYQLHLLAEYYPEVPREVDKNQIKVLFETLSKKIICGKCRRHFNSYIYENPYYNYLISKNQLRLYLMNLHNQINTLRKKKIVTLEEIIIIYQDPQMKNKVIKTTGLDICQYFDSKQMDKFVLDMNYTLFNNKKKKKKISENRKVTSTLVNKNKPIDLISNSCKVPNKEKTKDRPKNTFVNQKSSSLKVKINEDLWECYLNKYPDLREKYQQKQWPCTKEEAINHYTNCGLSEGREWDC